MRSKVITVLLMSTFAVGCNGDGEGSGSPLLANTWVTKTCHVSSEGPSSSASSKGIYEFSPSGELEFTIKFYTDTSCVEEMEVQFETSWEYAVRYTDGGEVLLEEGIEGRGLVLTFWSGSEIPFFSGDGYYTINSGELCFSDVFTFESTQFGYSQAGSAAIDFENCLVPNS